MSMARRTRRVRQSDIAKLVGLSQTTVSWSSTAAQRDSRCQRKPDAVAATDREKGFLAGLAAVACQRGPTASCAPTVAT
jgi:hypothetical protein